MNINETNKQEVDLQQSAQQETHEQCLSPQKPDFNKILVGDLYSLKPIQRDDFEALYAVAADPLIWQQHPNIYQWQRDIFVGWFELAMKSGMCYVIIDNQSDQVIGSSRFYEYQHDYEHGCNAIQPSVAIGFSFLSRQYWGGDCNKAIKNLMLNFAFDWVDVVWLHVAVVNIRSQKAVLKIGAKFDHEDKKYIANQWLDYNFYKITKADWIAVPE